MRRLLIYTILCVFVSHDMNLEAQEPSVTVTSTRRLPINPLVHLDAGDRGPSINGPTLMRVPDWIEQPLGRYYLYYATHRDSDNIRLLYADQIAGPWQKYEPGTLSKQDTLHPFGEVASPDILIDDEAKHILMYFHSGVGKAWERLSQATGLAVSADGLRFTQPTHKQLEVEGPSDQPPIFADFYFRVFRWRGQYFGVAKARQGVPSVWRSDDPRRPFGFVTELDFSVRHMAVMVQGDCLLLLYCDVRDKPERIRLRTVQLADDVADWRIGEAVDVLYPFTSYEGVDQPMRTGGKAMKTHWHGLRDPHLYQENGRHYLSYAVAGESGIALAEVTLSNGSEKPFLTLASSKNGPVAPGETVRLIATAPNPRFQPSEVAFYTYQTKNDPWTLAGVDHEPPFEVDLKVEAGMEFAVAHFTTEDGSIVTSMPPVPLDQAADD